MWAPLAADLARDHTVVVPDLRGMGLSATPAGRLRQEDAGPRRRRRARCAQDRASRPRHPRHRQHGRLRLRRAVSRPRDALRADGRAAAGRRARGRRSSRTRCCGTSASAARTWSGWSPGRERIYLDRFWNEFSADPEAVQRGGARSTTPSSTPSPGAMHAGFAQFARLRPGRHRQQGVRRGGQADDAGARDRRREIVRPDHGGGHARAPRPTCRPASFFPSCFRR